MFIVQLSQNCLEITLPTLEVTQNASCIRKRANGVQVVDTILLDRNFFRLLPQNACNGVKESQVWKILPAIRKCL